MRTAVIIPVFNAAATVAAATQSALSQEQAGAIEVIVVNDGSTDETGEVLKSFGGRIKTVSQANRGLAAARNAGADAAGAADYLAFLDADDLWLPDKLQLILAELARNHGAVLAYSDLLTMDSQGQPLSDSLIKRPQAHAPSLAELLRQWWPILPSSVVVRRDALERCGRFCEEFGGSGHEDVDCWLRLRELGDFVYLDRALVRYRIDPDAAATLKYETNFTLLAQRVRDRYGARGRPLLRAMRRGYVSAFGYRGLVALRAGDRRGARQAFFRALGYAPLDPQTLLRLGRTFLPAVLARSLSGNSRVHRLPRSRT